MGIKLHSDKMYVENVYEVLLSQRPRLKHRRDTWNEVFKDLTQYNLGSKISSREGKST